MYSVPVFISHSWKHSHHYDKLSEWLFKDAWNSNGIPVVFSDVSVPKDNPIHYAPNDTALKAAIYGRMQQARVIVIPTGMYATHSKWICKEIDGANTLRKPILAVNPWAQERKSSVVVQAAHKYVGWNKQSVGQAIWDLSRS